MRRPSVSGTRVARMSGDPEQRDPSDLTSDRIVRDILEQVERWPRRTLAIV